MACETCDHTMQRVNSGEPPVFWCPRCGTLLIKGAIPSVEPPKVVARALKCKYLTIKEDMAMGTMLVRSVRESCGESPR